MQIGQRYWISSRVQLQAPIVVVRVDISSLHSVSASFCSLNVHMWNKIDIVTRPLQQQPPLLLMRCRDRAHINTSAHAGLQLQVLKVGVSCLAIPLAGGVRPLGVGLSLHRAECCPEPLHKHLGNFCYPVSHRSYSVAGHEILLYDFIASFSECVFSAVLLPSFFSHIMATSL